MEYVRTIASGDKGIDSILDVSYVGDIAFITQMELQIGCLQNV